MSGQRDEYRDIILRAIRAGDARRILRPSGWVRGADALVIRAHEACRRHQQHPIDWTKRLGEIAIRARGLDDSAAPSGWRQLGVVVVAVETAMRGIEQQSLLGWYSAYSITKACIKYKQAWRRKR